MDIKVIQPNDAPALKEGLKLVRDVFWDFEAPDYSDEGILEFEDYIEFGRIQAELAAHRLLMWGAFVKGRVYGVLAVRPPCHISLLFVDKRVHRKGVGRALVQVMAGYFAEVGGCRAVTVHSSPFAVEAYTRYGFVPTGPEQTVNGLRFTPMECSLEALGRAEAKDDAPQ